MSVKISALNPIHDGFCGAPCEQGADFDGFFMGRSISLGFFWKI